MVSDRPDIKCVIVGHNNTGKTCLFIRICKGIFDPSTETTIGFSGVKQIPVAVDGQDNPITISLWDTMGDDRFMAPTRQFTRNANAALVCCSLDNTDFDLEKAKYWTHTFLKDVPMCKLYLVGTKCDLEKQQDNESKLQEYADMYDALYIETSSKENINISELVKKVATDWVHGGRKGSQQPLMDILNIDSPPNDKKCCTQ